MLPLLSSTGDSEVKSVGGEEGKSQKDIYNVKVAVRQEHILATSFHPEIGNDLRWHKYFIKLVREYK